MKKENQKALPLLALLLAAAAILLVFAAPARAGAKAGLALAENTVLPSLLPLLMLFLMIQNTRAGVLLSRALTLPAKALRLPPQAAGALLFGQIGGYPTGAVLTGELLDRGVIDRPTARRMLCFNVCGGVGFICTAVGAAALHSGAAGWLLLAANILANLTVAAVTVPLSDPPAAEACPALVCGRSAARCRQRRHGESAAPFCLHHSLLRSVRCGAGAQMAAAAGRDHRRAVYRHRLHLDPNGGIPGLWRAVRALTAAGLGRAVRAALPDLFGLPRRGCTFGRRLLPGTAAPVSPTGSGILQYIGDPAPPRYRQHHADSAAAGRRCGICA